VKLERYLLPGERRVVVVRRHPAMIARVAAAALLALAVAGVVTARTTSSETGLVWLVALVMVVWLIWRVLEWNANIFIVTNQRVMLITGLTTRRVAMLPLRRVQDMTYKRSPLGRLLGYGEFVIESAGETQGLRRITYVPTPDAIYLEISEVLFAQARSDTTRTTDMTGTPPRGGPLAIGPDD
jgi:uncharacterized membrane protein YdbT with pleckstrin-like domain